ncbi:MAG: DUF4838 domain-containing protein [Phycisphaeraceae bacterium]
MTLRAAVLPPTRAHPAVNLAHRELVDHLRAATDGASFGRTRRLERAAFVLGTFEDLGAELLGAALANDRWVDRVIVRSEGHERLILAGSNPRSVLFAVYTYLDALGFAWIVPGEEGHVVPRLSDVPRDGFAIDHTASLIYRGFGLAGAYDGEMGAQFVQWMARNRFNHLFTEGATGRPRYEGHFGRPLTAAEVRKHDHRVRRAAQQRGLLHEKMGHGWTDRVLGLSRKDREKARAGTFQATPAQLALTGELNGRRAIEGGNIQLCLSNPRACERMVEQVVAYASDHPEIDVLGVWMADGFNNWCECEQCRQVHPSDLWVRLINRISPAVYDARPDLRIEVLGYATLMEPPPTERIDNSRGNVILMYAPFLRCYQHALDDPACVSDKPLHTFPPANRLHYPGNYEYFQFLQGWLKAHAGTNYIFDYYAWLPIKRDIFEGDVARAMCMDMQRYPANGLQGMVDCSRAQSFWPTPMIRWMQARGSWDAAIDYQAQRARLLALTFGDGADVVDRYLALVYECLLPEPHGREEERGFDPHKVQRFKDTLPDVRGALGEAIAASGGVRKRMLQRVDVHAEFTALHLDCLLAEGEGHYDEAMALATRMHELARAHASLLAGVADPPEFAWLERDTHHRLAQKKAGTWRGVD